MNRLYCLFTALFFALPWISTISGQPPFLAPMAILSGIIVLSVADQFLFKNTADRARLSAFKGPFVLYLLIVFSPAVISSSSQLQLSLTIQQAAPLLVIAWLQWIRCWERALFVPVAVGMVLTAWGACIGMWLGILSLHGSGRLQAPFLHPATLSAVLAPMAVCATLLFFHQVLRRKTWQAVAIAAAGSGLFVALYEAKTRASLLAGLCGISLGLFLIVPARLRKATTLALLLLLATVGLYLYQSASMRALRKTIYTESLGTRALFGRSAIRMGLVKPLTGWGTGSFANHIHKFESPEDFLHGQRGDYVFAAHSEPLQVFAESGIPGLLSWLLFYGVPVYFGIRSFLRTREIVPLCAACGILAMMVDMCFSMAIRYPELPWFYALFLGLAYRSVDTGELTVPAPAPGRSNFRPLAFSGLCASLLVFYYLPAGLSRLQLKRLNRSPSPEEYSKAEESLSRAADFQTWYALATHLALHGVEAGEFEKALGLRQAMLAEVPADAVNRVHMVQLLHEMGRPEQAFALCLAGLRINRYNPGLHRELRRALRSASHYQVRSWLARHPNLSASEQRFLLLWQQWEAAPDSVRLTDIDSDLLEIRLVNAAYVAAAALKRAGERKALYRFLKGKTDSIPTDPRLLALAAEVTALEANNYPEALSMIERAIRLGRTEPLIVGIAASLYIASGNPGKADQVTAQALAQFPQHRDLYRIRIVTLRRLGREQEAAEKESLHQKRFRLSGR